MLSYQAAMRKLGDRVLSLLAASLDLPENQFAPYYDIPMPNVRLLKYPPQPHDAQFNQIGAGAHTDWGGITLLAQDNLGGLEVVNVAEEWLEATPIADTFVVNLGDLMARWTNGLYKSTMHRVRNNKSDRNRYSIAFFYSPRPTAVVECLPTCTDAGRPAQFPPCTVREHLDGKCSDARTALLRVVAQRLPTKERPSMLYSCASASPAWHSSSSLKQLTGRVFHPDRFAGSCNSRQVARLMWYRG